MLDFVDGADCLHDLLRLRRGPALAQFMPPKIHEMARDTVSLVYLLRSNVGDVYNRTAFSRMRDSIQPSVEKIVIRVEIVWVSVVGFASRLGARTHECHLYGQPLRSGLRARQQRLQLYIREAIEERNDMAKVEVFDRRDDFLGVEMKDWQELIAKLTIDPRQG